MPLRCIDRNGNGLVSVHMSDAEWEATKKDRRGLGLSMGCCGAEAGMRTSRLGTRFFYHLKLPGHCDAPPETPEHLAVKAALLEAARSAGWEAQPEVSGISPSGERWRVDVLCSKGKAQVALDAQISYQPESEYRRRQSVYRESGIRGCWFVGHAWRHHFMAPTHEVPAFKIEFDPINGIVVDRRYSDSDVSLCYHNPPWKAEPKPNDHIGLHAFVGELLRGEWIFPQPVAAPVALIPFPVECACGEQTHATPCAAAFPGEGDRRYAGIVHLLSTEGMAPDVDGKPIREEAWARHRLKTGYYGRESIYIVQRCTRCHRTLSIGADWDDMVSFLKRNWLDVGQRHGVVTYHPDRCGNLGWRRRAAPGPHGHTRLQSEQGERTMGEWLAQAADWCASPDRQPYAGWVEET